MRLAAGCLLALAALALSACGNECGFEPQCAGLTAYYHCKGPDVERTECPPQQFCAMDTASKSPSCTSGYTVTGTATYGKREATTNGLMDPVQTPVPNASLSVVDDVGNVMGSGFTADDGTYTVAYQPTAGVNVHLLLAAAADPGSGAAVVVNGKQGVFGYGGPSFSSEPTHAQDLTITDDPSCQSLNIFATAVKSFKFLRPLTTAKLPVLTYLFYPNFNPSCGACYHSASETIEVEFTSANSDGFDDTVIDHEMGHYVQTHISVHDSEGGTHYFGQAVDPTMAWSEGFASYYSSSARHTPMYIDTQANPSSPNGYSCYICFNFRALQLLANPSAPMTQNLTETVVTEILWMMEDSLAPGLGKPPAAMLGTMINTAAGHMDRGVTGMDLVDYLDEWFIQRGTDDCASMRTLLSSHRFPYDFQAPGHACP